MRIVSLFMVSTLSLVYACTPENEKSNTTSVLEGLKLDYTECQPVTRVNDSTFITHEYHKGRVSIDITNQQCATNFLIQIKRDSDILNLDLNDLSIPFKTPEVDWVSSQIISISNWWSGPFGTKIFVPIHGELRDYIYIGNDVELTDSLTNNVVYVDTVLHGSKIILTTENLLTRRKKSVEVKISPEHSEYPFYDSLKIRNETLVIWANDTEFFLDLKSLNTSNPERIDQSKFKTIEGELAKEKVRIQK